MPRLTEKKVNDEIKRGLKTVKLKDGHVDKEEFDRLVKQLGLNMNSNDVKATFSSLDVKNAGVIHQDQIYSNLKLQIFNRAPVQVNLSTHNIVLGYQNCKVNLRR